MTLPSSPAEARSSPGAKNISEGKPSSEQGVPTLWSPPDDVHSLSMLCKSGQVLDLSVLTFAFDLPKLRGVS